MAKSKVEFDVYTGNIEPYVSAELRSRFSPETVKEMPIVSAVNILAKTVDSRASLYVGKVDREVLNATDDQAKKIELIYRDMDVDSAMMEANRLYELQKQQTHLLVEPKKGRLRLRPCKAHQINVIPNESDPEEGEIYIFSGFDGDKVDNVERGNNGINEAIGDQDDAKLAKERFIVWSKSFHFVMNGHAEIITDDYISPLIDSGVTPVVEISALKDFTYWREITNDVAKFCVDYNVSLSSLAHVVELQGFAQAYLKAPEELMPNHIEIGPNRILRLTTNPAMEGDVEFGFANPNSDIGAAQSFIESLLAQFLSSQGLDPSTVSGKAAADKFSSGIERLLAQIERFEASRQTMSLFRSAEDDLFRIIKAYHNALRGSDQLDNKYWTQELGDQIEVNITFAEPQNITSQLDKIEIAERKVELGVWSRADAIAYLENITIEEAEKRALLLDAEQKPLEIADDN